MKKTLIVGASPNPDRYAYEAASQLRHYGHEFVLVGIKRGEVFGKPILDIRTKPVIDQIDTITLYIRPEWQLQWEDYLLSLKPKRIIFNPGTENPEFRKKANAADIETEEACTLVMLRTGQY
jgi:predicted CoA-binding protein